MGRETTSAALGVTATLPGGSRRQISMPVIPTGRGTEKRYHTESQRARKALEIGVNRCDVGQIHFRSFAENPGWFSLADALFRTVTTYTFGSIATPWCDSVTLGTLVVDGGGTETCSVESQTTRG